MKMNKIFASVVLATAIVAPLLVAAQITTPGAPGTLPTSFSGLTSYLVKVSGWFKVLFWGLTTIFLLYAAYLYLTGAGNEEKVGKAKQVLTYGIIAGIVALFAQLGLSTIIVGIFG
ncbi:MAG: hypothetical protein AAB631_02490 [Patescibacteria group bacterium]